MKGFEVSIEAAKPILSGILKPKANPLGVTDLDDLLQGCRCYHVEDEKGQVVAAYALRGYDREIWVQAAAGRTDADLCDVLNELIPRHGAGFASMAFRTYRRGLRKKAIERGFWTADNSDGFTMRKNLG